MSKQKVVGVVLTDTHLHANNIEEQYHIYQQVIDLAVTHNCCVYHGGDIFDSRKSQPLSVLIAFTEILNMFDKHDVKLYAIPGNHDKTDYDAVESYLDCFSGRDCFHLVREYECVSINDKLNLHMLPFFSEDGSYKTRLKDIKTKQDAVNLLLTHVAVNGVRNNDGSTVDNTLNRAAFKKFDEILVGHYHDQSTIHNVSYIGAAFQHNYGERHDDKGFTLIYQDGSTEFKQSIFKHYETWKCEVDEEFNSTLLIELEQKAKKVVTDCYLRVKFYGSEKNLISIPKSALEDMGVDVKLVTNEVKENIEMAQHDTFNSWDQSSIQQELKEFAKAEQMESIYSRAINYIKYEKDGKG